MHEHPHSDHTTKTKYPQYELPDPDHLLQYTQYAPNHPEYPQYYRDDLPTMYDPNDPRQQENQHQHRQYDTGSYHPNLYHP